MKTNWISISQLCDDDLHIHFDKRKCYLLSEDDKCIIIGTRTSDVCYQMNEIADSFSMKAKINGMELCKKLGFQL